MTRQIVKIPLFITKSKNIEGLLTLEMANKHKIGLFDSINFETYCHLNNQTSNYDNRYVVLTKEKRYLIEYNEPFTNKRIADIKKRIIRGYSNIYDLTYTGNDSNLEELTLSKLGQIFPDNESLEEYKKLFNLFSKENERAFYEVKDIKKSEKQILEKSPISNIPNKKRGEEIYIDIIKQAKRVNQILERLLKEESPSKKIYTIKKQ